MGCRVTIIIQSLNSHEQSEIPWVYGQEMGSAPPTPSTSKSLSSVSWTHGFYAFNINKGL